MANTSAYAKTMLDKLIELDHKTTAAQYEMGRILSAIQKSQLYDVLGYDSMGHLVEEELSFTPSTAWRYARMYENFRRLHYNKAESLALLKKCGFTHMADILPNVKDKIGERAIKRRIADLDQHQINFTVTDYELEQCHQALNKMGAMRTDTGRYLNSSQVFMDMIKEVNKRPVLKSVA